MCRFRNIPIGMTHQDPMSNFPQSQRPSETLPIESEGK